MYKIHRIDTSHRPFEIEATIECETPAEVSKALNAIRPNDMTWYGKQVRVVGPNGEKWTRAEFLYTEGAYSIDYSQD